ncbi:hypothetical protein AB0O22_17445 [Streptomyces sp. NPDC091204]|uniref:hypothetical protein n=1 Tax=Streptomyces sp. NPDC091204 TaxID=3155299 RepID=UPI00341222B6
MSLSARWLMAVATSMVTFGVCLWLAHSVSWGWLPEGEAEQWGVAAAFAAVAAGAAGAAASWWAGHDPSARQRPSRRILRARSTNRARIDQASGHRGGPGGGPSGAAPDQVQMDADASGHSRIRQTGGDDYTGGDGTP